MVGLKEIGTARFAKVGFLNTALSLAGVLIYFNSLTGG